VAHRRWPDGGSAAQLVLAPLSSTEIPQFTAMKTIRVLLVASVFSLVAGIATANCGSCDKKDHCAADKAQCSDKCNKEKSCCGKDCQCPDCTKECAVSGHEKAACPKDCQCPKCKEACEAKCQEHKAEPKK